MMNEFDDFLAEKALNAVRTLLALHESKTEATSLVPMDDGSFAERFHCKHCWKVFPCPTVETIRRAMM
jgi:hypothetical protein